MHQLDERPKVDGSNIERATVMFCESIINYDNDNYGGGGAVNFPSSQQRGVWLSEISP
jgi:hypothetical protein